MSYRKVKQWIRNSKLWEPILAFRAANFEYAYRKRRDAYFKLLQEESIHYDEKLVIADIQQRLRNRGYTPELRKIGGIRTFSIIGECSWHNTLLRCLQEIGEVYNCDYTLFNLEQWDRSKIVSRRQEFNDYLIEMLRKEHRIKPFDWVFAYVNGRRILSSTLNIIHEEFGIPTVNMWLDDKNRWVTGVVGCQDRGQIDIAAAFDISWTTSTVACGWYLAEGGRPVYMPEGCDPSEYYPRTTKYDIPMSFMGANYGCRNRVIHHLEKHGVPVRVYGKGWGRKGHYADSPAEVFSISQINFGIGGIADSEAITNVKGRDFDVTCTGGGVYLTTYNPDLAMAFEIGKEILCYRNRDEAIEMVMHYLDRPDECRAIAKRAREKCLLEHQWSHRFIRLCRILRIIQGDESVPSCH